MKGALQIRWSLTRIRFWFTVQSLLALMIIVISIPIQAEMLKSCTNLPRGEPLVILEFLSIAGKNIIPAIFKVFVPILIVFGLYRWINYRRYPDKLRYYINFTSTRYRIFLDYLILILMLVSIVELAVMAVLGYVYP